MVQINFLKNSFHSIFEIQIISDSNPGKEIFFNYNLTTFDIYINFVSPDLNIGMRNSVFKYIAYKFKIDGITDIKRPKHKMLYLDIINQLK